jgi:hypothetical protein
MTAGMVAIPLALLAGLDASDLAGLRTHFGAAHGSPGPGLGVYAGLAAGLLMLVGGSLILRPPRILTLVVASAAAVLLATSTWGLVSLSAPASPEGVTTPTGFYRWPAHEDASEQEYFDMAYETCAAQRVGSLARVFEIHGWRVKATPEAVATAYARVAGEPAVYHGCLAGFRVGR